MRQFMHGNDWWGLHDDGTWVRWNNLTLEWDPQAEPPPSTEMKEVPAKVPVEQGIDPDAEPAKEASIPETGGVDPVTGLPLPPGSKAYQWTFNKTLGTPPDQIPPGAKTFRWRLRKTFGPFPLEGAHVDPNASPEELRRAVFHRASRRAVRAELWLGLVLAALAVGGLLLLLWLIDLGFHIG